MNETRNTILLALAAALVGAVAVVTWPGPVLVVLGLAVLAGMAFAGRGE